MGFWKQIFGGADGIREAIRSLYQIHLERAQQNPASTLGDSPHEHALYQALGKRYLAMGKKISELVLWSELSPFLAMSKENAVAMLCEYVVHQSRPEETMPNFQRNLNATVAAMLKGNIDSEFFSSSKPGMRGMLAVAYMNGVYWCRLLYAENTAGLHEIATPAI